MYMKNFEAESLDEALKNIKRELGPDAIILKTITNNGLKGAFKKAKICVTAAISEKEYSDKANVDKVLNQEQKELFYNNSAASMAKSIKQYNNPTLINKNPLVSASYGNLSLNRQVKQAVGNQGLDEFLNKDRKQLESTNIAVDVSTVKGEEHLFTDTISNKKDDTYSKMVEIEEKMLDLEGKITQLNIEKNQNEIATNNNGLREVSQGLICLGIKESIIKKIMQVVVSELGPLEIDDMDKVNELVLKNFYEIIEVEQSLLESDNKDTISILFSEFSSGQSCSAVKLAARVKNCQIIEYIPVNVRDHKKYLAQDVFDIHPVKAYTLAEIVSCITKAKGEGKKIIIDFCGENNSAELSQIIDTIKRSFGSLEVLLNLSSINSENINKKMLEKYKKHITGLIYTYFDKCLDFGTIINAQYDYKIPILYFGTGPVVPKDIEVATKERLLSQIFDM